MKPEQDPQYMIERLNAKINADAIEMEKMRDDCVAMQAALERKKASEQLAAWAIDRAIETLKKSENVTAADVMKIAGDYCDWIATFRTQENKTVN